MIQNHAWIDTDLNSSHSQLSRAVLNVFIAPVLAENRFAGDADHTLSRMCTKITGSWQDGSLG